MDSSNSKRSSYLQSSARERSSSPRDRNRSSSPNGRNRSPPTAAAPKEGSSTRPVTLSPVKEENDKDGDWDFPPDVKFPVTCKVAQRFYKMAEEEGNANLRKINVSNCKVEVKLNKTDFYNKKALEKALTRESELLENSKNQNINNPKFDFFSTRKESEQENYKITKMSLVIDRLHQFVQKKDFFMVEVIEQIVKFAPKSSTIKVMINNNQSGKKKTNRLSDDDAQELKTLLNTCNESSYDPLVDKITCGICKAVVKTKTSGSAKNVFYYYKEKHYNSCFKKKGKKRGIEETDEEVKQRLQSNKKKLLDSFKKTPPKKTAPESSDEDFLDDPDDVIEGRCETER